MIFLTRGSSGILFQTYPDMGLSENVGYIPNEIAIFHRDHDQQNHWVQWGTQHFQTYPDIDLLVGSLCFSIQVGDQLLLDRLGLFTANEH